jgi:hypothetical protein
MIKSRRMICAGNIARVEKKRNAEYQKERHHYEDINVGGRKIYR